MTNPMLRRYQTTRLLDHNIPQMLSMMFYALSRHMGMLASSISTNNYYERHQKSEKIIASVSHLMMILKNNEEDEESIYIHDTIMEFCHYILRKMNCITRDNDAKLCYDMVIILEKMGGFFEQSTASDFSTIPQNRA